MQRNKAISNTATLTTCALLTALSVILARFLAITPSESARISFETVPIFLAGMLFGPVAGALVGFTSDFIGSLLMFGFNPMFCIPPILYGLCGGLFRPMLRKTELWRIAVAYLPPIIFGSWLWQSLALSLFYGGEAKAAKLAFFYTKLAERGIQFALVFVVDVLVVYFLCKAGVFRRFRS